MTAFPRVWGSISARETAEFCESPEVVCDTFVVVGDAVD